MLSSSLAFAHGNSQPSEHWSCRQAGTMFTWRLRGLWGPRLGSSYLAQHVLYPVSHFLPSFNLFFFLSVSYPLSWGSLCCPAGHWTQLQWSAAFSLPGRWELRRSHIPAAHTSILKARHYWGFNFIQFLKVWCKSSCFHHQDSDVNANQPGSSVYFFSTCYPW